MKRGIFQAIAVLFYGMDFVNYKDYTCFTVYILDKASNKKYLYGHLPPISQIIRERLRQREFLKKSR